LWNGGRLRILSSSQSRDRFVLEDEEKKENLRCIGGKWKDKDKEASPKYNPNKELLLLVTGS
jgi:hypothetical protein